MGKQSREKLARRSPACPAGRLGEGGWERPTYESKTGLEKTCIFIIRWGAYASLFIPLIVMTQFFFPFVAPKTTIFRILVEIIFAAYLFLAFSNSRYRPKIDALTISITAFLAVFILSSFTGINLSRSFWSTYERMTGIFTMLHLYAFFIILKSVFKKKEDWQKFLAASIVAGVLLSLYVLIKGSGISTRGGGTIGNSSFLAAYLIFDIFFAIILFLSHIFKKTARSVFLQIFSGVSLLIMLPVFLNSTARGAIAAFFIGLFLLFLGYLFFSGKKILKRIALSVVLASVILAVFLAITQPSPVKKEIKATLSEMSSRFVVWETGLQGFLERPILGWGPENFNTVFQKKFNPCMSLPECGNEVWFDRVHNIVFDTLVTTGVVGLSAYLSIFFVVIYGLLKIIAKITEKRNIFLPLGLIVASIAYFLQNLLVFDMINSYLVFFLVLAFTGFLIGEKEGDAEKKWNNKPLNLIFASMVIILMIFISWFGNIKPLIANRYIIKAVASNNAQEFIVYFQKSLDTWMEKYETREQADQKLVKSSKQLTGLSLEDQKIFTDVFNKIESEMEKSVNENYLDFRHRLFLGELYLNSYRVIRNPDKLEKAEAALEKAIELSPANQQGYWQLTDVKLAKNAPKEALSLLKKAVELHPRVGLAHWYLALGYKINGNPELFMEESYMARKAGYDWLENQENMNIMLDIYRLLGEEEKFGGSLRKYDLQQLEIILNFIESEPRNYKAWELLATIYANLGQYDKAREAAQKTVELRPESAQGMDGFLQSLPQ